ncbi:MAG: 4-hydroxythreonine-4-phosphate dehydrogenase PdxA [Planctomycetaceae bacterium]|nr:4-hydroxythreonine-4-phosphate dehydrogenase PdxA [Planctomycetaceae bacterium]
MNGSSLPRLAITLGDVAGIGPEVVVRALADDSVLGCCRPVIIGDGPTFNRAAAQLNLPQLVDLERDLGVEHVQINTPGLELVRRGTLDARAGEAAFQCLATAIDMALAGDVQGIVTAPLSKYALHLAGHDYPGHTEILAERCGVREFAMMLYLPVGDVVRGPHGLAVAHTTLHTSIASVPGLLSAERITETITLTNSFLRRIGCPEPRIGVCALNPHAGEDGLFGREEEELIRPAVETIHHRGVLAQGPLPADTLLKRAVDGEFDGVVAMYHDQGHIALKLIAFGRAVNVTLGLPIVRTSPSHGTAFDIADKFQADSAGMIAAIRLAARLSATP